MLLEGYFVMGTKSEGAASDIEKGPVEEASEGPGSGPVARRPGKAQDGIITLWRDSIFQSASMERSFLESITTTGNSCNTPSQMGNKRSARQAQSETSAAFHLRDLIKYHPGASRLGKQPACSFTSPAIALGCRNHESTKYLRTGGPILHAPVSAPASRSYRLNKVDDSLIFLLSTRDQQKNSLFPANWKRTPLLR
jgi:hypothetical protein